MKKLLILSSVCFLLFVTKSNSQIIKTQKEDTISYWEKTNKIGFDISQISFVNWNAGGNNSISGLIKGKFIREFSKKNINWKNELIARYGLNKQEGQEIRKTDDQLLVNSTFGYRTDTISNWYHGAKATFSTQFYNGYSYPNIDKPISRFMAPAYFFLGIGSEYKRDDLKLNVYLSPLTQKTTLVLDSRLANQGAFGVTPAVYDPITGDIISEGRKSRTEVGILITNQWEKEIWKIINL